MKRFIQCGIGTKVTERGFRELFVLGMVMRFGPLIIIHYRFILEILQPREPNPLPHFRSFLASFGSLNFFAMYALEYAQ